MDCYLGLGSNLNNPLRQVERALLALHDCSGITIRKVSSLYRSRPMGPPEQPDFINAVVKLTTTHSARALLELLIDLEQRQGRTRAPLAARQKNGPRTLDLDLLLYGAEVLAEPGLTVPHPGLHQRDFVLYPLFEIAPELEIPGHGHIAGLLFGCVHHGLVRIGAASGMGEESMRQGAVTDGIPAQRSTSRFRSL